MTSVAVRAVSDAVMIPRRLPRTRTIERRRLTPSISAAGELL
jgi:hypothetical protein